MRVDHGVRYVCFCASAAAILWLAMAGIIPIKHPFRPNEYLIDTSSHSPRTLRNFFRREDVILALTWAFATAGPTLVLPSDFNTASNQIDAIGSGTGGAGGTVGNNGGRGGAGGAFAQIVNYSGHSAGQTVNCTVGPGDTIFDTSLILLAKAGSGQNGGTAAASVGATKFSGGNGGNGSLFCNGGGSGGGGGGAGGPNGAGNNGGNGTTIGGAGATADAGNTAAAANGTQFGNPGDLRGSGGGGAGGRGTLCVGFPGNNAGFYGGGGGGGGGGFGCGAGGAGGNATQGLIGIGYTPGGGGAVTRSYGFIIG